MASFERAIAFVLEHEGEWSHDPRGGRTRWGIASRWHPEVDLDTLTREGAAEIYRKEYWRPLQGDLLPEPLGLVLFDWAVPHGVPTVVRALQGVLGVMPDGKLGKDTLAAIGSREPRALMKQLLATRKRAIQQISRASTGAYEAGWLARLVDVILEVL